MIMIEIMSFVIYTKVEHLIIRVEIILVVILIYIKRNMEKHIEVNLNKPMGKYFEKDMMINREHGYDKH
jgi:hypothetical protein